MPTINIDPINITTRKISDCKYGGKIALCKKKGEDEACHALFEGKISDFDAAKHGSGPSSACFLTHL